MLEDVWSSRMIDIAHSIIHGHITPMCFMTLLVMREERTRMVAALVERMMTEVRISSMMGVNIYVWTAIALMLMCRAHNRIHASQRRGLVLLHRLATAVNSKLPLLLFMQHDDKFAFTSCKALMGTDVSWTTKCDGSLSIASMLRKKIRNSNEKT